MNQPTASMRVVIADFDMPFWSLVNFMIKVAVASIPATIILSILGFVIVFLGSIVLTACGAAIGGFGS
jgi:hypothetical protein